MKKPHRHRHSISENTHTEYGIYFVNPIFCLNKHTKINFLTKLCCRIKFGGTFHLLHNSNVYIGRGRGVSLRDLFCCLYRIDWMELMLLPHIINESILSIRKHTHAHAHTIIISASVQKWTCRVWPKQKRPHHILCTCTCTRVCMLCCWISKRNMCVNCQLHDRM